MEIFFMGGGGQTDKNIDKQKTTTKNGFAYGLVMYNFATPPHPHYLHAHFKSFDYTCCCYKPSLQKM